jgi:hypothetical protein
MRSSAISSVILLVRHFFTASLRHRITSSPHHFVTSIFRNIRDLPLEAGLGKARGLIVTLSPCGATSRTVLALSLSDQITFGHNEE